MKRRAELKEYLETTEEKEAQALLKLLDLGNQDVAEGRVEPVQNVIQHLRQKRSQMIKKKSKPIIELSPEDQKAFAASLIDPPALNEPLSRAFQRRTDLLVGQIQNPESKAGASALFEATTVQLGAAAVDGAQQTAGAMAGYLSPSFLEESRSDDEIMAMAVERGWVHIGLKAFFRIIEAWGLSEEEGVSLLGFDHRPTESEIGIDPLKRISYILGIYRAIHTLLPNVQGADAWIKKSNDSPLFGGKPAIESMLTDGLEGIESVRNYLFAQLNGW